MKLSTEKLTQRQLRIRIAAKGMLTIDELCAHIGKSRTAVYHAIEKPSRYPLVYKKILEVIA